MRFFLGTHKPHWLRLLDVPLFVSRRTLAEYRKLPRARGEWALDSGGFTELSLHGRWQTDAMSYSTEARRYYVEVGNMAFCAPMDWMCEPHILAKTGFTVAEHQRRTVANYCLLRQLAPDLPWAPVLQGWRPGDYLDHVEQYARAGVDLAAEPVVGLGSVCRRQGTAGIEDLVRQLHEAGIRLHGFGLKLTGLRRMAPYLASADSMAWSFDARRGKPLAGCTHTKCSNCIRYAMRWREKVLRAVSGAEASRQGLLF